MFPTKYQVAHKINIPEKSRSIPSYSQQEY